MQNNTKLTQQFHPGDAIMSAMGSSDREDMKAIWRGFVAKVMKDVQGSPDGCCYVTLGKWDGNPWGNKNPDELTSRQLWCRDIEIDNGN